MLRCLAFVSLLVLMLVANPDASNAASPDGSILQPGTSGSLTTNSGTWTFSASANSGGNLILLNGVQVAGGSGVKLQIANGGQLYVLNAVGKWYVWNGSGYTATTAPTGATNGQCGTSNGQSVPTAPTTNLCTVGTSSAVGGTGPWTWSCAGTNGGTTQQCSASKSVTVSPDGSILQPGTSGNLRTGAGTWTFSASANSGGNLILLNGVQAAGGSGVKLQIANGGQLYVLNAVGKWYVWTGSGYAATTAPTGATNGQCGSANNSSFPSAPTTNLCTAGTTSPVAGTGPWTWSCAGTNGGTNASCSATKTATVSPDGSVLQPGTGGNLVNTSGTWTFGTGTDSGGNFILLNGARAAFGSGVQMRIANGGQLYVLNAVGKWYVWTGSGYAATTSPVGTTNGQCGSANGVAVATPPSTNLCSAGTAGSVSGTGPFNWSCSGTNGGTTASCSAPLQQTTGDLQVGPTRVHKTILSAVNAASNGNTIVVDPGTYNDNAVNLTKSLTIKSAQGPGTVIWQATQNISNGKGLIVVNANLTVEGITFQGAKVTDMNGAGIRFESGNLIVKRCLFRDNQNSILTGASGTILIQDSWLDHAGAGDGFTHNIYVGALPRFEMTNSLVTNAVVGHGVKSRAQTTIITNSRILDMDGTSSYSIDMPNGGAATLTNNIIQQSINTQNPIIVAYGAEGNLHATSSLTMVNNTIVNDRNFGTPVGLYNFTTVTASLSGTKFYGLTTAQFVGGPNTQSGSTLLSSRPAISTDPPWATAAAAAEILIPNPSPVACGSADGSAPSSKPESNLCTAGTASSVAGTGPWTWSCAGTSGGTNASCSSNLQSGTIPILKTGKVTTAAALSDQSQICSGSRLFPAQWTAPKLAQQPLPATSGTPKIEQVRNGAVIATWKYLGSGICGGDDAGVYNNPQASADKNCGPFGRSHFFGSWKPGDIFLVYPAVYTGEENQPFITQSHMPAGMTGPANLILRGVTVNGVRPVLKVGPNGFASNTTLGQGPLYLDQIDGITIENIDIDNDHAADRAVSRAGVYMVAAKDVTLRQMRIHGFNSSQANGILATIRGTLTLDQMEFYENGGWPDSLAHNLYITGSEAGSTVHMINSWSHNAYAGHLFKSRTTNNIIEGSYFQGGLPSPGFNAAENYDVDIPNGGNAIVRNNVFVKNASGDNTNGIALAYALEGNPDSRQMTVDFEHNTFIALARFYDTQQHALIPLAFFYPPQVPVNGVLAGVSSVKVSKNLFVGYCPLGNAVSDYRGDLSETIGFSELLSDYSTNAKYQSEEQNIIGTAAYKHEAQPGLVRTAPIIGARD